MSVRLLLKKAKVYKMTGIRVINPGFCTTIQDLGRKAYQASGMPVAGSMDDYAHRMANLLVANDPNAPLLELTAFGGSYEFHETKIIAITGGDMSPKLNGREKLKMWRTLVVEKGDILSFEGTTTGFRTYLSVAGGFNVPKVMKSYATYMRGGVGGYKGRMLKKDDAIEMNAMKCNPIDLLGRFVRVGKIPSYETSVTLRVVLGPQEEAFTRKGIADFVTSVYTVTNEADRMGYRLEGRVIEHETEADIISDGIVKGAVQVPGHGNPIIMMADCQTTGGYTKIAHVISSDLWKIAQLKAGDEIKFKAISLEEAHSILKERHTMFKEIDADFDQYRLEGYKELLNKFN